MHQAFRFAFFSTVVEPVSKIQKVSVENHFHELTVSSTASIYSRERNRFMKQPAMNNNTVQSVSKHRICLPGNFVRHPNYKNAFH
jgi:hypothetical protein